MYFDAHAHLHQLKNLHQAIHQAQNAGITGILTNAIDEADWNVLLKISTQYSGIYVALGIHPCAVACLKSGWDKKLEELLKNNPQVMVGEIGLDGQYPNLDAQEKILRHQLNLAWKYHRPAVIHCFRAWERLIHILKTQRNKLPPKIMFHSHHGNPNLIPEFIQKYNTYFSYSSIFVPANHPKIQACLKATPLDRLLVESDCPDLARTPTDIIPLISQMSQLTKHNPSILKKALFQNAKNFVRF